MISTAYAQQPASPSPAAPEGLAGLAQFAPMVLIFLVFYFLLIRPQQKQQKRHREMVADTKRGDEVVTTGGLFGRVTEVKDDHVLIEIADDTVVKLEKNHIQSIKGYGEEKKK